MAQRQLAPSSLFEAHEALWRQRPSHDAAPTEWAAFHRRSAEVYAAAAKVDVPNRSEASQYAAFAIRRAREIEHRLDPSVDDEALSGSERVGRGAGQGDQPRRRRGVAAGA